MFRSRISASDSGSYRSREEFDAWRAVDPIVEFTDKLWRAGALDTAARDEMDAWATERVAEVCSLATDSTISPRLDLRADPGALADLMFSHTERDLACLSSFFGCCIDWEYLEVNPVPAYLRRFVAASPKREAPRSTSARCRRRPCTLPSRHWGPMEGLR